MNFSLIVLYWTFDIVNDIVNHFCIWVSETQRTSGFLIDINCS